MTNELKVNKSLVGGLSRIIYELILVTGGSYYSSIAE